MQQLFDVENEVPPNFPKFERLLILIGNQIYWMINLANKIQVNHTHVTELQIKKILKNILHKTNIEISRNE